MNKTLLKYLAVILAGLLCAVGYHCYTSNDNEEEKPVSTCHVYGCDCDCCDDECCDGECDCDTTEDDESDESSDDDDDIDHD